MKNTIHMKNDLIKITAFLLAVCLWQACGTATEQKEMAASSDTDTAVVTTTGAEINELPEPQVPLANIREYFEALQPVLAKKYDARQGYFQQNLPKITIEDLKNGYLQAMVRDGVMGDPVFELALWKTAKGEDIVGVFEYTCGGEGCWGNLKNLQFFDAQLKPISEKVLNWADLHDRQARFSYKSSTETGAIQLAGKDAAALVKIPQQGTSIEIILGTPGIAEAKFVTLVFDKAQGRFNIQ